MTSTSCKFEVITFIIGYITFISGYLDINISAFRLSS